MQGSPQGSSGGGAEKHQATLPRIGFMNMDEWKTTVRGDVQVFTHGRSQPAAGGGGLGGRGKKNRNP